MWVVYDVCVICLYLYLYLYIYISPPPQHTHTIYLPPPSPKTNKQTNKHPTPPHPPSATYVHRVGRTARAGCGGRAISLVPDAARLLMKEVGVCLCETGESIPTIQSTPTNNNNPSLHTIQHRWPTTISIDNDNQRPPLTKKQSLPPSLHTFQ